MLHSILKNNIYVYGQKNMRNNSKIICTYVAFLQKCTFNYDRIIMGIK